ncbi:peptidoglycan-binding protein [Irregularibacter muris]|uniref:Peptidoglycan-binding protein n=2 Tax=Irregularibacter muris TaxID=1796619 RepID=A0AAE3HEK7_9FIRM|nr:peptidoglycan-binding protein [Irregularibacter muris]
MNLKMLKHTIIYFIAFTIIIGLTSTFVAKQFMGKNDLIGLTGSDITRMQVVLNGTDLPKDQKIAEKDKSKDDAAQDLSEEEEEDGQSKEFQKGDAGAEIKEYQTVLSQLGYLQSKPDGAFGSMTYNAILKYQEENKLEATGKLDKKTMSSLRSAKKEGGKTETSSSENGQKTNSREHTVQSGDSIYVIGEKYGIPVKDILQANNLSESSVLQLGQVIKIPEKN